MLNQSKIEVWYKVSGERILLGETFSNKNMDVISLWVGFPFDQSSPGNQGYRLSLFDDDGRHIADKRVTQSDAESVLRRRSSSSEISQAINQLCFSVEKYCLTEADKKDDHADLAFI